MNSFGLGLVLNFTDNASAGMRRASQAFNEMNGLATQMVDSSNSAVFAISTLTAAGMGLTIVGENISSVGNSILGLFTTISESVIDTGGKMQGFRSQLQALYGVDLYEQKLQEIKDYAQTSVFEAEGLVSAVSVMKAVGIEAMNDITTSSGNTTQKLLDYASDIAAMFPNMRNSYGTGVEAAMGALKEYIAEGNALSLKRGAGLDITGLLGEDKGKTIEERTQQVADLVEQLGIAGYTASLAGTPTQQLAKIQDTLFNIMSDIADSGVYETYTELLTKAATWVDELTKDTDKYNAIVSIMGDTITSVLKPLSSLLDYAISLADAILDWAVAHPTLTKWILTTVAALGALLVVGGQVLKFAGSIFLLTSAFMQMKMLATSGISIFNVFGRAIGITILKAVPFLALAGLIYLAWSKNLFGIRDTATKVFQDLGAIFSIIKDAWGDFTLSEENFKKAKELGILPLIEGILQLKYYWDFLVEGFKSGFKAFFDGLFETLNSLGIIDINVADIVSTFGEFLDSLIKIGQEDKWTKIGEVLGKIAGIALIVIALIKPVMTVISVISKIIGIVSKIIGFVSKIGTVFSTIGTIFSTVGGAIMSVLTAIAGALGLPVIAVVAIIAAVIALGVIIVKNWDKIKSFLSKVGPWVYENIILPVRNFFATVLNFIVGLVATIWEGIKSILTPVAEWVSNNIIQPVVNFFKSLWDSVVKIFTDLYNDICRLLTPIAEWVNVNVVQPVTEFFKGLWSGITDIFNGIYDAITGAFKKAYNKVIEIWSGITDFFGGIWDKVSGWASGIIKKGESITGVKSSIPAAATGVKNFVGGLIQVNEQGGELITLPSGSTVIPHDDSVKASLEKGIAIGANSLAMYAKNSPAPVATGSQEVHNDYSVTFSAGSVVIQLANATDAELEKAAEKLMKIIQRKQQLKSMAVRV